MRNSYTYCWGKKLERYFKEVGSFIYSTCKLGNSSSRKIIIWELFSSYNTNAGCRLAEVLSDLVFQSMSSVTSSSDTAGILESCAPAESYETRTCILTRAPADDTEEH